ncbi:MAG: glutamate 5-kinase, partial [Limisphaerales bacterium]
MRASLIKKADRMVIKLGTGVLTDARNHPDLNQMETLVSQLVALRKLGKEIVIVSSGAVGAGMGSMGWEQRPGTLADLQACAAVGQTRL